MPILVTTTHPGLPLPSYSIGTPPTHFLALCHHRQPSTFTQGNSNGNFMCMHMPILGICLPMHTPLHIMPLGPYLPTFLLSFIGTLFIHGWGAIKNPILLGCNTLFWPFLSITISKTVHPWLGSH